MQARASTYTAVDFVRPRMVSSSVMRRRPRAPAPGRTGRASGARFREGRDAVVVMGEELARCHLGALLRARRGCYYCARCLGRLLGTIPWTKRDARRAIAVLFEWPVGLRTLRRPCWDCGHVGGARLGVG